jgi:hypothetical protein
LEEDRYPGIGLAVCLSPSTSLLAGNPQNDSEEIDLFESIVVQEDNPAIPIKEEYVEPVTGANK